LISKTNKNIPGLYNGLAIQFLRQIAQSLCNSDRIRLICRLKPAQMIW